ncbi:MAG TPA: 50S ribosomal protein L17 [Alphaproteobacteria bacterium]|nr:50S ribosomal protein L17 [Alphaproteobacteria bacterium]
MKHRIKQNKLQRNEGHRTSLLANLTASLIEHEQITTTLPKARELKAYADKIITLGKKGDLSARRSALSKVRDESAVKKLFDILANRYKTRNGGYTRVLKFGFRKGDSAPMAVVELIDRDVNAKGNKDIIRVKAERQNVQAQ